MKTKERKRLFAKIYVFLALILILTVSLLLTNQYAQNQLPNSHEIRQMDENVFLTFAEYEDLRVRSSSAYSYGYFKNDIPMNKEMRFVLTDENYQEYYSLNLVAGQFFDKDMVENRGHYAVISDDLALEMFLTYSVIGQNITIENYRYEIIGVYMTEDNYYSTLAQDSHERVYIPYTSITDSEDMSVVSIAVKNDEKVHANADKIFLAYPYLKYYTRQINYSEKKSYVSQFPSYITFIFQVYMVFMLIGIGYKVIKNVTINVRSQRHRYYFKELIKENIKQIITALVTGAVCFTSLFLLFKNLSLRVAMSNWFMPEDNLFNMSHYLTKIAEFFTDKNTYLLPGNNYYLNLVDLTLISSVITLIILIPLIVMFINAFKKLAKKNYIFALEIVFYLAVMLVICLFKLDSALFFKNAAMFLGYFALTLGLVIVDAKNVVSCYIDNRL